MSDERFPGPRVHTALNGRVSWNCVPLHSVAGRAVQEGPSALRLHDGLDVEWLRERLTAALIEAEADDQLGPEYSPDALAWYLTTRLAASPLNEVER